DGKNTGYSRRLTTAQLSIYPAIFCLLDSRLARLSEPGRQTGSPITAAGACCLYRTALALYPISRYTQNLRCGSPDLRPGTPAQPAGKTADYPAATCPAACPADSWKT